MVPAGHRLSMVHTLTLHPRLLLRDGPQRRPHVSRPIRSDEISCVKLCHSGTKRRITGDCASHKPGAGTRHHHCCEPWSRSDSGWVVCAAAPGRSVKFSQQRHPWLLGATWTDGQASLDCRQQRNLHSPTCHQMHLCRSAHLATVNDHTAHMIHHLARG